ncbi:CLUMA_CG016195, isoform A [Clunio marinus]|uniref:CLUMA_CG016195, isoform A n=1 Tax=Clunio marinus TaxID=568069 RepID=A0A1J1ITS6_9DIPT|nr:CLUMA_CG016195, isoform A [Clunio marinus]
MTLKTSTKSIAGAGGSSQELIRLKQEFERKYQENEVSESSEKLKEYKFLAILGQGAFGLVKLVKHEPSDKFYAVKIQAKEKIVLSKQVKHFLNEKRILSAINFPFVVNLMFSLKDNSNLYLGMPFINGGEMFTHLRKVKRFEEDLARFYGAQVALGLEYLHFMGMVYRDLKPENIMIDHLGYIKITDFGFCKILKGRTYTLCGTPEYLAPEIIQHKGYGTSVDWWSYGVLLFEMSAGYSPFSVGDPDQMQMMDKIVQKNFRMSSKFSHDLKNLIGHLLETDLTKRYGNLKDGVKDIKNHSWFKVINWSSLYNQSIESPFVPQVSGPGDYSQFDKFNDIFLPVSNTDKYEKEFADF